MAFDMNNFVIDRVIRGVGLSKTDNSVLFSINQIQNASLNCASESTDAVDALGTPIATFYRAKSAEFSAENAIYDMNLMATQLGTEKKVAGKGDVTTITVPAMETFEVPAKTQGADGSVYTLKHTPVAAPTEIYVLKDDSTFGEKYTLNADATAVTNIAATEYIVTGNKICFHADVAVGTDMFVVYEYESSSAVEVVNSANEFPTGCKFVMEVLGCDVCDQTKLIYAYVIFNNFKLSPDFDWSIATDGAHPFSGKAQQDYCDKEKRLFSIVIPQTASTAN